MIENLQADERGVSEVVGAILVFGIVIVLLGIIQAQAIPAANQQVEVNHNKEVQSDFVNFNEAMSDVATEGVPKSVKIQMGTSYPSRLLFFNPSPPGGEIRTAGSQSVEIGNVQATDPITRKYIDGDIDSLTSRRLEYDPTYNEYQEAPVTVLEYGAVYRDFNDTIIIDDETNLVKGNTISLTLLNGNLSQGQSTALSLEAQATSAPARTVTVEPETPGDNVTILLPTRLNESQWDEMLAGEDNVLGVVDAPGDQVEVRLDGSSGEAYNLRIPQIGVGSGVPTPNATYMARSSDRQLIVDEANTLPIEVRDKYNNPVSGEEVNITVDSGGFDPSDPSSQQSVTANTSADGRPAVNYYSNVGGVVLVNASYDVDPTGNPPAFDPQTDPKDISVLVTFDPRTDTVDPSFVKPPAINETQYSICTAFNDIPILGNTVTSCLIADDASVLTVDYNVSDTGGAGLDYIELGVVNASGGVLLNKTHAVQGNAASGRFFTPQIIHSQKGEPAQVDVRVYDRNSNTENASSTLP